MAQRPAVHRVLVIDDDEILRDLLDALLSLEGYEVRCVSSGEEAHQLLGAGSGFDLVLTDLNMPGVQGEALAQGLRAVLPAETLLIGISAGEPTSAVRAHLNGFLRKPFDVERLHRAIDDAQSARLSGSADADAPQAGIADVSTPVLNEGIFVALLKSIPASQLRQLYEMTLDDIAKRHRLMVDAAAGGDLNLVRREAHTVKGSCGMVGATEIQALAASIEGGTTINTSAMDEIPAACHRLRRMLDTKLQTV